MTSSGPDPGLCGHCLHCRVVTTDRSIFYLCERAFTDPHYRKYPPLPVRACPGYQEHVPGDTPDKIGR